MVSGVSTYVIREWQVSNTPKSNGEYIRIQGRAPGLISWFLSLIGIEPSVDIRVTDKAVFFESGSWSGNLTRTIPLSKVSSVLHGFTKPWKESLILFAVLAFISISIFAERSGAGVAIGILFSLIIAMVFYLLNKKLMLGVFEVGGLISGIHIKRSVIEGKKLDAADAAYVGKIIQGLMLREESDRPLQLHFDDAMYTQNSTENSGY